MTQATIAILIIYTLLIVYAVFGSIDFGSGFWSMYYQGQKNTTAKDLSQQFLSPFWEISNVFLVFFVVSLITFFPKAAFLFGTLLLVPASIILLLLLIRSAMMGYAHAVKKRSEVLITISGISGILIPGLLISVLPVAQGGYINQVDGRYVLSLTKLFTSPLEYNFLLFGVMSSLFISALFLCQRSLKLGDKSAFDSYLKNTLVTAPISYFLGVLLLVTIAYESPWLYEKMRVQMPWLLASSLFFIIGYALLFYKRQEMHQSLLKTPLIPILFGIQLILAAFVYGRAHFPYIIYPILPIDIGMTNSPMYTALLYTTIIGLIIMVPAFYLFFKLFFKTHQQENS